MKGDIDEVKRRIERLRGQIDHHNYRYYVFSEPIISGNPERNGIWATHPSVTAGYQGEFRKVSIASWNKRSPWCVYLGEKWKGTIFLTWARRARWPACWAVR